MRDITKTFPGVKALQDVSSASSDGEVHAICGENGAGKSTLMKVLSGVYPHGTFEGEILFEGEPCEFSDISDSEQRGIVIIHQELALSPVPLHRGEHLPRQRAGQRAASSTGTRPTSKPPSCCTGSACTRTRSPSHRHRRRQAAARRDRQGALQGGQAPHPGRADRRAQRRRLGAPARPDPPAEGPGHHLHHHQPQAQRDQSDRRPRHHHPRRQDHRDPRHAAEGDHARTGSSRAWSGRDLDSRFPDHTPHIGEELLRDRGLDRPPPARPQPHGRRRRQPQGAARRDRRHRRADGRRPHRARDERLRSHATASGSAAGCSSTASRSGQHRRREAIEHGIAYATEDRKLYGLNLIDDIKRNISIAALGKLVKLGWVERAARRPRSPTATARA